MADITDIMNQGLRAGGLPMRIQDYYDGDDAARVALEIFSQSRDELLRIKDWSFSRRIVSLTLLKGPPPDGGYNYAQQWSNVYPAPGWLYEFAYPSDCLDIRAIIPPPFGMMPDLDPVPAVFRVDNDVAPVVTGNPPVAAGPPAKVIYCNVTNALAVYRAQVTDPSTWEVGFVAALVASLGKKFAVAFGANADSEKTKGAEAVGTAQAMSDVRG